MKKIILITLIALSSGVFAQQNKTATKNEAVTSAKHRAIFQLSSNDPAVWTFMMRNIKNLKEALGENTEVEVVVHGPGIELLLAASSPEKEKIADFKKQGVSFVACENTMKQKGLTKNEILPDAGFVPSGVGELVLKQEAGWSYLKAGY